MPTRRKQKDPDQLSLLEARVRRLHGAFPAGLLRFMQQHDYTRVATRPEPVDEWTRIVIRAGEAPAFAGVDSWQNGVNRNVDGRTVRRVLGYNGNGAHFRRTTDEVAKGDYQEFAFR